MTTRRHHRSRRQALVALIAFVLTCGGSLVLHRSSVLHDTDAYYHLAIARLYGGQGFVDELPQLRMSLLGDGFGDKELLFHAALAPLATGFDAVAAGRIALALLAGLAAAMVAALAARTLGWWGLAVPFWLFYASTELAWRMVRLRPELLSLVLLLAALAALGARRDRLVGLVALLYTWSYTAFQALLGLVVVVSLYFSWSRRRFHWRAVLYAVLGTGIALVLHPHFPKNLEIWVVQNVEYFLQKDALAVGTEIRPNFTDVLLMVNLGWFLGLGVLGAASRRDPQPRLDETDHRLADAFGIATLAFAALYLLMSRFAIYFFPFATLWWLLELRRRGRRPGAWCALPVRGRVPLALAAALCLLVSLPEARRQLANYQERTWPGPNGERLRSREALSAAIPDGAHVAADWGPTATLMLWAPQGRYLNVLDPVFMAIPYPEAHRRLASILAGAEPDVPAAAAAVLGSDHLVYRTLSRPRLAERLAGDPRVEVLHRGTETLVRFRPRVSGFVLDWRPLPEGVEPFDPGVDVGAWPPLARSSLPGVSALEGYVDAERVAPESRCLRLVREIAVAEAFVLQVELAPYGPASVWLDGRLAVAVQDELGAVLGRSVGVSLPLSAGRHRVMVYTCEGSSGDYKGFYWRERG